MYVKKDVAKVISMFHLEPLVKELARLLRDSPDNASLIISPHKNFAILGTFDDTLEEMPVAKVLIPDFFCIWDEHSLTKELMSKEDYIRNTANTMLTFMYSKLPLIQRDIPIEVVILGEDFPVDISDRPPLTRVK